MSKADWKLVDKTTGKNIDLGSERQCHNTGPVIVKDFIPPHKPESTGRVVVTDLGNSIESTFFPGVINAEIVPL